MKKLKKIIQACKLKKKLKARKEREIEKKWDKERINDIKKMIKKFEEDGWIKLKSSPIYFDELTFENEITEYEYRRHLLEMSDSMEIKFWKLENAEEGQRLWAEFLLRNADKIVENVKEKLKKQMKNNL
jgi:hypothetical protein